MFEKNIDNNICSCWMLYLRLINDMMTHSCWLIWDLHCSHCVAPSSITFLTLAVNHNLLIAEKQIILILSDFLVCPVSGHAGPWDLWPVLEPAIRGRSSSTCGEALMASISIINGAESGPCCMLLPSFSVCPFIKMYKIVQKNPDFSFWSFLFSPLLTVFQRLTN